MAMKVTDAIICVPGALHAQRQAGQCRRPRDVPTSSLSGLAHYRDIG
jgi:hypothetical protein